MATINAYKYIKQQKNVRRKIFCDRLWVKVFLNFFHFIRHLKLLLTIKFIKNHYSDFMIIFHLSCVSSQHRADGDHRWFVQLHDWKNIFLRWPNDNWALSGFAFSLRLFSGYFFTVDRWWGWWLDYVVEVSVVDMNLWNFQGFWKFLGSDP